MTGMRRTVLAAVVIASAMAPSAGAVPPPTVYCDPGPCLDDRAQRAVENAQECVMNAEEGIRLLLQGTPQPWTCGPF
jgi:hypothetical protein